MRTLVAIGYPDETTAAAAVGQARGAGRDPGIEAGAIAVVSRNRDGVYQVDTTHHAAPGGAAWGMFWGLLFGDLLLPPGPPAAAGRRLGALMGAVARNRLDPEFRQRVREVPEPGASALFLVVDTGPDPAVERLRRFGGTVLTTPLSIGPERLFVAGIPC